MATGSQSDLNPAMSYATPVPVRYSTEVSPHEERNSITIVLEISPELDEAMEDMAIELDGTKSDVFVRALALLRLVTDARKTGKRVCITDDELNVETEVTGFGPLDDELETEPSTNHE